MTEDNEQTLATDSELLQAKISQLTVAQYRSMLIRVGLHVLAIWTGIIIGVGLLALVIIAGISSDNAKSTPTPTPSHRYCDYTSILTCAEQGL